MTASGFADEAPDNNGWFVTALLEKVSTSDQNLGRDWTATCLHRLELYLLRSTLKYIHSAK